MRLTRARAQQGAEEAIDATERAPLNEISSNGSPKQARYEEELPAKTPAKTPSKKTKGKSRAKKGKKGKAVDEEEELGVTVPEDEEATADAPVNEEAGEDDTKTIPHGQSIMTSRHGALTNDTEGETADVVANTERPVTPPPKPMRMTRRQIAMQEEAEKQSQCAAPLPQEPEPHILHTTEEVVEADVSVDTPTEDTETGTQEPLAADSKEELVVESAVMAVAKDEDKVIVEPEASQEIVEAEATKEIAPEVPRIAGPQNESYTAEARVTEVEPPVQPSQVASEATVPSIENSAEPEPKSLGADLPNEAPMTPHTRASSIRRHSRSPSKSPMRLEESFEALDALEEALENVTSLGGFERVEEEKTPVVEEFAKSTTTSDTRRRIPKEALAAVTRVSKAPSVAAPKSLKPVKSSLARTASVRVASNKEGKAAPTETVDYLASKRRPVSICFPTPPPPPKGRAPTRPTFQLSSNDVVAKLKTQKEERQKREAEGVVSKTRPLSMPPQAKSSKPLTKPSFQLPGEKIAVKLKAQKEEREKREAQQSAPTTQRPASISMAPHAKSTKAPTKANFELPGSAVAEKLRIKREERLKRMEEAEAAKKEAALKTRQVPAIRKPVVRQQEHPGVTIPPPQPQPQPQPQAQRATSLASKRSSISLLSSHHPTASQSRSTSNSSASRNSIIVPKAVVTPIDAVQQKIKGREVFNRDRIEKEARERERREKEEAAKRARAEAAERGRIASREWAEKQRRKMMGV
ncbi:Carboxylesterase family [Pyrenophora seminiperda CCB06]|uniref:Carboxylesterase family n=1 Tax=Pyrenophora seminiperda CCB06 TaxID=1302712 RepID=A0A3M7LV57_9PLEO|nr:Carboxylesterase family [Pyrenophora seminiperda CCB06]